MAKWKNLTPGTLVIVKERTRDEGDSPYAGRRGVIIQREPENYKGRLGIEVQFDKEVNSEGLDDCWWLDYDDVRLVNKV